MNFVKKPLLVGNLSYPNLSQPAVRDFGYHQSRQDKILSFSKDYSIFITYKPDPLPRQSLNLGGIKNQDTMCFFRVEIANKSVMVKF